jgi:hypothetical protein
MILFWLLAVLSDADLCKPVVEPPSIEVDPHSMEINVSRSYGIPWVVCAQEKGARAPVLRVTAKDGSGAHVLLEKTLDLRDSLRHATDSFSVRTDGCEDVAPNRRDPSAVLQGPVGNRHWYNRRVIEVELVAEGALLPLAFKAETEVFCRACSDGDRISMSYYVNDFDKNTTRMILSVDKARYECAKGGGRMVLRRFWADPAADEWAALQPYEVVDNMQDRLKPEKGEMSLEVIAPSHLFCKAGKQNLFELVGVDEYAGIILHNYGPSDAIHRGSIEFLKCGK